MIETYKEIREKNDETLVLKNKVRSLEERIKYQDRIIFKQRRIIRLQSEVLTEAADMHPDKAFVKAIKELQDEEVTIIKEAECLSNTKSSS